MHCFTMSFIAPYQWYEIDISNKSTKLSTEYLQNTALYYYKIIHIYEDLRPYSHSFYFVLTMPKLFYNTLECLKYLI